MSPRVLLVATVVALAAALLCVVLTVWTNAASRNIALAGGTILAATVLFMTQLFFELQGSNAKTIVSAEYTIDLAKPEIRQWDYDNTPGWRLHVETTASAWLVQSNPQAFNGDRVKLTNDLLLYSVLGYFGYEQFDWQLDRIVLTGSTFGQETRMQRLSTAGECAAYPPNELARLLRQAGNLFSGHPQSIIGGALCLPPHSILTVTSDQIEIANSFCNVLFKVRPTGSTSFTVPGLRGEVVQLPTGGSRYETRLTGLEVTIDYHGLRAQHKQLSKYRAWAERVVAGATIWFEGKH
jgi:hypothetical protein